MLICSGFNQNQRSESVKRTLSPTNQAALRHFDKYYAHVYGAPTWAGIRAALLCPPAKVAVLNASSPVCEATAIRLQEEAGCINLLESLAQGAVQSPLHVMENNLPGSFQAVNNSVEKHYLVDNAFGVNNTEFVPPVGEFVGEHRLYSRDSDVNLGLTSAAGIGSLGGEEIQVESEDELTLFADVNGLRCMVPPVGEVGTLGRPRHVDGCYGEACPLCRKCSELDKLFLLMTPSKLIIFK